MTFSGSTHKKMGHLPILVSELLSLFSEESPPQQVLDCTFGRGGHSLAFLKKFPKAHITALDCDHQAVKFGCSLREAKKEKMKLINKNFHEFVSFCKKKEFYDLILMDLGVSSPQLDEPSRGFSFYQDGPLDMRMDQRQKLQAKDIINTWNKKDLIALFQSQGEIRNPYKVVSSLIEQRRKKKFETTRELSQWIQKFYPHKMRNKHHPATAWFLALRIQVNQELEGLKKCLPDFLPLLKNQGYLAVISFHSLEDRIVKKTFKEFIAKGQGKLWNKKVIRPSFKEKKQNPRSRSAKMRVYQKTN